MAKQVSCRELGIDCVFRIRDADEAELIELVQRHAENTHGMDMSADDVRGAMSNAK